MASSTAAPSSVPSVSPSLPSIAPDEEKQHTALTSEITSTHLHHPVRSLTRQSTRVVRAQNYSNKFDEAKQKLNSGERVRLMLRQSDPARVIWDMFITVLLLYIAVMLPYTLGFEDGAETSIDQMLNYFFLIDVALNS